MYSPDAKHVMISYQWDVQKLVIQIKNKLQADGFKVWMDIDEMGGSTLESMAKAVENASVMLLCVSQEYKESPNCRSGNDENCFATPARSFDIALLIIEILAFYWLFRICNESVFAKQFLQLLQYYWAQILRALLKGE